MDVAAPDYSIVLPAYNEEALVPATLERLRDAMAGAPRRLSPGASRGEMAGRARANLID